jgi:GDP-D-mannose 3',5'-epimerase
MKRILVTGVSGFIGHHLAKRLVSEGHSVLGLDINDTPPHEEPKGVMFARADLLEKDHVAYYFDSPPFDEVYHLAAFFGGMTILEAQECKIASDNVLMDTNVILAAAKAGCKRFFFSSSQCVYRNQEVGEPPLHEDDVWPAKPDNTYGVGKLFTEELLLAHARHYPIEVRIARFANTFGEESQWCGGQEKAPAAFCRKVAEMKDGGEIPMYGDGSAVRAYTYVDDLLDGILMLMRSDVKHPVNIGAEEYVTVRQLVEAVCKVSGKQITPVPIEGPVGVTARYVSSDFIRGMGWKPKHTLADGLAKLYPWISEQVEKQKHQ